MADESGLIQAYKDLITSEHRGKPKFERTVVELLKFSQDIYATAVYMDDEFDIDLANGAQEDVLGVLVGASRELGFQPHTQATATLNDEDYRILLKAKVAKNLWKGGIADLQRIWYNLFGEDIIILDNQDMSIEVQITNVPSSVVQEMILQGYIVPKPQSVRINYNLIRKLDSQYWIGGAPSQHNRIELSMSKPQDQDEGSTLYYGAVPMVHHTYRIDPIVSDAEAGATLYFGGERTTHKKIVVSAALPDGSTVATVMYQLGDGSTHKFIRI